MFYPAVRVYFGAILQIKIKLSSRLLSPENYTSEQWERRKLQ